MAHKTQAGGIPHSPRSLVGLRDEEQKIVRSSQELLASDRLAQLAGRELRLQTVSERTAEALEWLDRRLEAELNAAREEQLRSYHKEGVATEPRESHEGHYEELLPAHAEVEILKSKLSNPRKSRAQQLRERIEHRGEYQAAAEKRGEDGFRPDSSRSYLSEDGLQKLEQISAGKSTSARQQHAEEEGVALWADKAHRQEASTIYVKPYPDIYSLSNPGRCSAAPHISQIYENIFIHDVEDTLGRPSMKTSDSPVFVTLIMNEKWDKVNGGEDTVGDPMNLGRRSHYERLLLQSISSSLQVPIYRLQLDELYPGPSWYRVNELHVHLVILPDPAGTGASCSEIAANLVKQAEDSTSVLRRNAATCFIVRINIEKRTVLRPASMPSDQEFGFSSVDFRAHERFEGLSNTEERETLIPKAHQQTGFIIPAGLVSYPDRMGKDEWKQEVDNAKGEYPPQYGAVDTTADRPWLSRRWRIFWAAAGVSLVVVGWLLYMFYE